MLIEHFVVMHNTKFRRVQLLQRGNITLQLNRVTEIMTWMRIIKEHPLLVHIIYGFLGQILCREKQQKEKHRNHRCLTGVLQACSNTLHRQDEGILQTRGILTCWVQVHKFISCFAYFHKLLGDVRTHLHMVVWIPDSLQCVGLANIQGSNVGISQPESLFQVGVPFKKILVSSSLPAQRKGKSVFVITILSVKPHGQICYGLIFVQ